MKCVACMPIMVVSINTLFLYDDYLLKNGITNVIDSFVRAHADYDKKTGEYKLSEMADFDGYLRRHHFNKRRVMMKWHESLIRGFEEETA